jgi:hypothetical protein
MLRAVMRHHPINWKFHRQGIYRAISPTRWTRPKREGKIWHKSNALNAYAPQGDHLMKMTITIDTPPILGSPKFRNFPKKLTTQKQRKDHHKKLFIPLLTFEALDFPVPVRRIEFPGDEVHRGGVRLIRH